jgi:hypothetical protein
MPTAQITDGDPEIAEGDLAVVDAGVSAQRVREVAIGQVRRKRRFHMRAFSCAVASVALVIIWAISEYYNEGGWPTKGFSQGGGIPHEWNIWIVYPLLGFAIFLTIDAWNTYVRKPISEREIQREIDRLTGER